MRTYRAAGQPKTYCSIVSTACVEATRKPRLFVVVEEEEVVVVTQHIVQASPLYVAFELSLSVRR